MVAIFGGLLIVVVAIYGLFDLARRRTEVEELSVRPKRFDPFAGGYPVPPLPGQKYRPVYAKTPVDDEATEHDEATVEVRGG